MTELTAFVPTKPGHTRRRFPDWLEPPAECPCCGGPAVMVNNRVLYGRPEGDWPWVYFCLCCAASVGCHPYSIYPKGTMATRATARLRLELHRLVDPWWQGGRMSRDAAYDRLGEVIGRPPWLPRVHIGHLDAAECERAIELMLGRLIAEEFGSRPG